eukprot:365679-Chlamydomonas_euryale.AAC.6
MPGTATSASSAAVKAGVRAAAASTVSGAAAAASAAAAGADDAAAPAPGVRAMDMMPACTEARRMASGGRCPRALVAR